MTNPTRFRGVNGQYPRVNKLLSIIVADPNTIAHLTQKDEEEFKVTDTGPVTRTDRNLYNTRMVSVVTPTGPRNILVANLSLGENTLQAFNEDRFVFNAQLGVFMWREAGGVNVLPLDENGNVTDVDGEVLFQLIKPITELSGDASAENGATTPQTDGLLDHWANLPSAGVVFLQKLVGPTTSVIRTNEFALENGLLNVKGFQVIDPDAPVRFIVLDEKMERMRVERLMAENFIESPRAFEVVIFDTYGGASVVITSTFCAVFDNQLAKRINEAQSLGGLVLGGIYQSGLDQPTVAGPGRNLRALMTQIDDQIPTDVSHEYWNGWMSKTAELEFDQQGYIVSPDIDSGLEEDYLLDATTFGGVAVDIFRIDNVRLDGWSRSVIINVDGEWRPAVGLEPHELMGYTNLDELGTNSAWAGEEDMVMVVYDGKYAFLFDLVNDVVHYNSFDALKELFDNNGIDMGGLLTNHQIAPANVETAPEKPWVAGEHPVPREDLEKRTLRGQTRDAVSELQVLNPNSFTGRPVTIYELAEQLMLDVGNRGIHRLDPEGDWQLAVGFNGGIEEILSTTLAELPRLDPDMNYVVVSDSVAYLYDPMRRLVHRAPAEHLMDMLRNINVEFNCIGFYLNGAPVNDTRKSPLSHQFGWQSQTFHQNPRSIVGAGPIPSAQPTWMTFGVMPPNYYFGLGMKPLTSNRSVNINAQTRTLSDSATGVSVAIPDYAHAQFYSTTYMELSAINMSGARALAFTTGNGVETFIYDYTNNLIVRMSSSIAMSLLNALNIPFATVIGSAQIGFGSGPFGMNPQSFGWHGPAGAPASDPSPWNAASAPQQPLQPHWGHAVNPEAHGHGFQTPKLNVDHLNLSTADITRAITLHDEISPEEIKNILAALITKL